MWRGRCAMSKSIVHSMASGPADDFWRVWLTLIAHDIAARLAETVEFEPSIDERTREIIEQLIAIEQELAA